MNLNATPILEGLNAAAKAYLADTVGGAKAAAVDLTGFLAAIEPDVTAQLARAATPGQSDYAMADLALLRDRLELYMATRLIALEMAQQAALKAMLVAALGAALRTAAMMAAAAI